MAVVRDMRYASRTLPGSDYGERRLCRSVTGALGKKRRGNDKKIIVPPLGHPLARMRAG
jgi:hypothetical protein